jgi:hypothetical protein
MPPHSETTSHPVLTGLTPRQAEAAIQPGPVLVLAGAGTGKTKGLSLDNRIGRKESGWWQRRNERIGKCE